MKRLRGLTPWQILVRSALICSLIGVILFGISLRKIDRLPLSSKPLEFDAFRAHSYMKTLSKRFPGRVPWSESRKEAAIWLKEQLSGMGYQPQGMRFSEVIDGKEYTDLENVYAEKRGTKFPKEIIVAMAHYDITDTTHEGAMDDASGVGVVLELARILSNERTDRTIIFLLTDSEEFGAFWGARVFAKSFGRADQIVAAASFDFVAPEKQTAILTLTDGLKSGYTPLWVRELALDSLRSVGTVEVLDMTNIVEFAQRALQIPAADHGAFLQAGIPAFNWVGQMENFPFQMAHYHHTEHDVAEAIRPQSFVPYGRAAERFVRSVDELHRIPADPRNSSYWKITSHRYIDGWVVTLLHILAFIPFIAFCLAKFRTFKKSKPLVLRVLKNEAKSVGIVLGSFLVGYVVILLLPALRVITQYELFPATQKSSILYSPQLLPLALVGASVTGVYWVLARIFREPEDSTAYIQIRHALHAALLLVIILLAFLKNSYLAVLLLLPPAYCWTLLRFRRNNTDRLMNTLLLLGGAITFVVMTIVMSTIFHVGVVYWYLFLSAAYGLVSAYAVVLFFMALTVMVRLFRSFVL